MKRDARTASVRRVDVPDRVVVQECPDPPAVSYGQSTGPPTLWSRSTLSDYRMQCDMDPFDQDTILDCTVNDLWDTDPETAFPWGV